MSNKLYLHAKNSFSTSHYIATEKILEQKEQENNMLRLLLKEKEGD